MTLYESLKALHLVAIVAWFAGLFYLPRLFVYHVERAGQGEAGGEMAATFALMERRLLRAIMNPAMIAVWILGLALIAERGPAWMGINAWMHAKILLVIGLSAFHMALARWRRQLEAGTCARDGRFFRLVNEVPTLALFLIVALAVFKWPMGA